MAGKPTAWLDEPETGAPDAVAAYRGIEEGDTDSVRRQVRGRAGRGSTDRLVSELATLAAALTAAVAGLPGEAFALPGGEGDWTVAEAVGHDATSRAGPVLAASLAASGRWPADRAQVVPGVPGPADAELAEPVRPAGAVESV